MSKWKPPTGPHRGRLVPLLCLDAMHRHGGNREAAAKELGISIKAMAQYANQAMKIGAPADNNGCAADERNGDDG